jgi:hypothetical protein
MKQMNWASRKENKAGIILIGVHWGVHTHVHISIHIASIHARMQEEVTYVLQ